MPAFPAESQGGFSKNRVNPTGVEPTAPNRELHRHPTEDCWLKRHLSLNSTVGLGEGEGITRPDLFHRSAACLPGKES